MQPYKNLSGKSGVVAYESGSDFIRVEFLDGKEIGHTNCGKIRVMSGTHEYTFRKNGAEWKRTLTFAPGKNHSVVVRLR